MTFHLFLIPVYLLTGLLPLATDMGANLEYEYALSASYLGLLLLPATALVLPASFVPGLGQPRPTIPIETLWTFLLSPILGLLPSLYLFATGSCPCSATGFAFWMAVIWYPAWILSHAGLYGIFRGRERGMSGGKLTAAWLGIYLAVFFLVAAELWFNPQKRALDFFYGFLHGPIYDEWIAFDTDLLLGRLSHFLLAATLLLAAWFRGQKFVAFLAAATAGAWGVASFMAAGAPSTSNDAETLEELLPRTLQAEHFTLHYRTDQESGEPPRRIQRIFRDTRFHITELKRKIDRPTPSVDIYVYPTRDQKKLWFGGGDTDVTDVFTPSIHITDNSWPHPTLRHELVHALTSDLAFHGLGFHPNMAFTEGLAVALAPRGRTLGLHESAASLLKSDRLPPVQELFSPAFWKHSGHRAYTVAGSLILYMIEKHGAPAVFDLYGGADWTTALEETPAKTLAMWKNFIQEAYDPARSELVAEALYRDPGVFQDLCPHSKADLARSRSEGVFTRLRQPIGWDPSTDYLPWLRRLDPDDKSTQLRIWNREIDDAAEKRNPPEGRLKTWRKTIQRARQWPPEVLEDVEMALLVSDLHRLLGAREPSLALLEKLKKQAANKYFGRSLNRQIHARLSVERQLSPKRAEGWRRYLAGWGPMPGEPDAREPWILHYLHLRNPPNGLTEDELTAGLEQSVDPSAPVDFHLEWYRILGHRLMSQESYTNAQRAYEEAARVAPASFRRIMKEHSRRARFYGEPPRDFSPR